MDLDEIIIKFNKKLVFGNRKVKLYAGFSSTSRSTIFAKKIMLDNNVSIIKAHFDIQNNYIKKDYRILIFDMDEELKPGRNILNKNIVLKMRPNEQFLTIDLMPYDIQLKKGNYYLGIEIFNLSKAENQKNIKIGLYKTTDLHDSFFKPVFDEKNTWSTLETENKKKIHAFNFYLTIQK